MQIKKHAFIIMLICVASNYSGLAQQLDFDIVTQSITADLQSRENIKLLNTNVSRYLISLQGDGTWSDINYKDNSLAVWSPSEHLSRIEDLVLAYGSKKSNYTNDETLFGAIIKALRGWNVANPLCKNWWYNEIYCPKSLGRIMLLLQLSKPISQTLQDSLLKKMDRGEMQKQTGANKLDVAIHYMYSALLTHNVALMDTAVSECFQPVMLTSDIEGLQYDYSYFQHGPQLQIASYGSVFLSGEFKVASYVAGTRWQMSSEKQKILTNFLNHTYLNAVRYKYLDFSVLGRGFSLKGSLRFGLGLGPNINKLILGDYSIASDYDDYNNATERISGSKTPSYKIKPQHNLYWIGDYTQHIEPDYLFTVRANSTRTGRTETGNGANLYGRYMSDGATDIQRSGSEYFNIFPIWEYDKIPGVTCREYIQDRPAVPKWVQPGTTNFTGGVSDGLYGTSTYTLDFDSVKAQKAWFFFEHQIVCMGSGIQSSAPERITTAINQCWARNEVVVNGSKQAYWQDSIGYYIMPGDSIHYTDNVQKGDWKHVNSSESADEVSGKVFKLWIDHGISPQNAGYVYAVVPGISAKQFTEGSPFNDVEVLSNTNLIQAVLNTKLNVVQSVFYQPGQLKIANTAISVDKSCVLMIETANTDKQELFIADPTQKLTRITVTINGKNIICNLPEKPYAGSTAKFEIK